MANKTTKPLHRAVAPVKGRRASSAVVEDQPLFDNSSIREWLTTTEAAEYLKVSMGTLFNMTSNGTIRCFKLGRRNRYRLEDLIGLLKPKGTGGLRGY